MVSGDSTAAGTQVGKTEREPRVHRLRTPRAAQPPPRWRQTSEANAARVLSADFPKRFPQSLWFDSHPLSSPIFRLALSVGAESRARSTRSAIPGARIHLLHFIDHSEYCGHNSVFKPKECDGRNSALLKTEWVPEFIGAHPTGARAADRVRER